MVFLPHILFLHLFVSREQGGYKWPIIQSNRWREKRITRLWNLSGWTKNRGGENKQNTAILLQYLYFTRNGVCHQFEGGNKKKTQSSLMHRWKYLSQWSMKLFFLLFSPLLKRWRWVLHKTNRIQWIFVSSVVSQFVTFLPVSEKKYKKCKRKKLTLRQEERYNVPIVRQFTRIIMTSVYFRLYKSKIENWLEINY